MSTTIVLMGVAGCGKTTVMAALAERLGWATAEGDSFHSDANVAKMRSGAPLTDADRRPWLESLAVWIGQRESANGGVGEDAVVTCSALKRSYRDLLRDGHPTVRFVHLVAPASLLRLRLGARQGHYMPPELLASQLATLEPLGFDEPGTIVPTEDSPNRVIEALLEWIGARYQS